MNRALNTNSAVRKPSSVNLDEPGRNALRKFPVLRPALVSARPQQFPPVVAETALHKIGLYSFCGYMLSGYGNDLSIRIFGGKAYLSWIFGTVMLFAFFLSGTALRGLRTKTGKLWAGIAFCLVLSALFSIGRSESLSLLKDYFPKTLFEFFYCCAFALNLRNCRTLIFANIACTTVALFCAILFGEPGDGGRLAIPDSMFLGNPNDLALVLVSGVGFCLFLIWQKSPFARILGAAELLLTLYFLLKTGSRGGFLALAVCLTALLLFGSSRARLILLAIPAVALVAMLPGSMLSRLVLIVSPDDASTMVSASASDLSTREAVGSQMERTAIFQKSVTIALTHPILGTGPSTFVDALWDYDVANGTHTHAIGPHNTYTQVASECGFPALFLYLGVIFTSLGSNYRIMRRTRKMPGAQKVFTMASCLFGCLIAFAVATIFHHDAYSPMLPAFSGMSAALALASRGGDPRWIESEIAAGHA